MSYYIGIDPGIKGAISVVDQRGNLIRCTPFEFVIEKTKSGRKMKRPAISALNELFSLISKYDIKKALVEKQVAMPGQNSVGTFNTGKGYGIILTLLEVYHIDYEIISCKEWQEEMIQDRTPVESKLRRVKRKQLKLDSVRAAIKLFPDYNFKRTERSKVDSDGLTDSALIAAYCQKKYEKSNNA